MCLEVPRKTHVTADKKKAIFFHISVGCFDISQCERLKSYLTEVVSAKHVATFYTSMRKILVIQMSGYIAEIPILFIFGLL